MKKKTVTVDLTNGYTQVSLGARAGINTFGLSVEFDPHFLSQNVAKGVAKPEDWAIIEDRVTRMGINRFRVMLLPSWIEPFNDNDDADTIRWDALTTDNEEMRSLYKVLDLAQKLDIDVNLTLWGAERYPSLIEKETGDKLRECHGHFLQKGNDSANWVVGTLYPEEFAENFSMYLQHLLKKGYTCIKEVTPINEPDWSYLINDSVDFENYKKLCYALHERFQKDGIRDKVLFNLSDNTEVRRYWLQNSVDELDAIADLYNSHTYIFGYASTNETIFKWEEENCKVVFPTGKPHVIGEFGSDQVIGAARQTDIDKYERGVLMVRQLLNYYNAGASGASYWSIFDQYYTHTDPYESMMMIGLWKGRKELYTPDEEYYRSVQADYEVRPQYYAVALMTKYVPKGSEVYPIDLSNDFALGTAFKGKDGKWTYVFANGNAEGEALKIALNSEAVDGEFDVYTYAQDSLPKDDSLIPSSGIKKVSGQVLAFELAPQTVTVLKQR